MKTIKWNIHTKQGEISFQVRKLLITTVKGSFNSYEGSVETESENFINLSNLEFQAKVASIRTDDEKRDIHLKSSDFFDLEAYPFLSFRSQKFSTTDSVLQGELTIRNITNTVSLNVEFLENSTNEKGDAVAGLLISGTVNRQDFGLSWNGKNEAGEIIVGDKIILKAQVSFIKLPTLIEI